MANNILQESHGELDQQERQRQARQRMQRWLLSDELREHMRQANKRWRPTKTGPFITISRESGAGGSHIARIVGQRLDWDVLDKEILDFLAQRYGLPRDMLDFVDETQANWVHDILGNWFDSRVVSHEKYVIFMERILRLAALHGKIVVVGRAGHCVLPRESGLAVRIVAPQRFRVENMMRRRQLSSKEAGETIDAIDAGRQDFCQRYFHQEVRDPSRFDLTINVERFSPEAAAEQIIQAYRSVHGDLKVA